MTSKGKKAARWPVAKLKDHPMQAELFRDMPPAQFADLVASMKSEGLQHPVEITPDGTIIGGHQRTRAARQLEWKTIDVIVRYDLAEAGAQAVELYLMSDNDLHRDASPLMRARRIQRRVEIECGKNADRFGQQQIDKVIKEIGRHMKLSDRNVRRYLRILRTPKEIQEQFDRGLLTLEVAGKVDSFHPKIQSEIVARIQNGGEPHQVVEEYLSKARGVKRDGTTKSFLAIAKTLKREVPALTDVSKIRDSCLAAFAVTLGVAVPLLQQLLQASQAAKLRCDAGTHAFQQRLEKYRETGVYE